VQTIEEAIDALDREVTPVLVTERQFDAALQSVYREEYVNRASLELLSRAPQDSAAKVWTTGQLVTIYTTIGTILLGLVVAPIPTLIALTGFCTVFYFLLSGYKLFLIYRSLAGMLEETVTPEEVAALDDRDLPIYTVLVPVYKEAEVLPILVDALGKMDYPRTKLDVIILLEEDDQETQAAARAMRLPEGFRALVVPYMKPKTKPKACNYGLLQAEGEFLVIYDAEDVPEPDQLKKAVVVFRRYDERLACIQSKLNYFNRDQNLLTRWFTLEYSTWFDLLLPGLDNTGAPIPLGGTSNHFRADLLRELGGWDPFNTTEDADLGLRIFKRGYRTVVMNSTTYEEANSNLYNWIRQRSRWVKGYMQTWLVHMRNPLKLYRELGFKAFFSFQMIVGGTFFALLLNPVFWVLTALWFIFKWDLIRQIYPGPIFYLGAIGLYVGNFAFVYINVSGALRREYYHLVKYALLTPLYWGLMSVAAWQAFRELIFKPHYWQKTQHGLFTGKAKVPTTRRPLA
jgi:glycosyltransferase XagB